MRIFLSRGRYSGFGFMAQKTARSAPSSCSPESTRDWRTKVIRLSESNAQKPVKTGLAGPGDIDDARPSLATDPAVRKEVPGERGADAARQMRAPFTPVEAGPAEHAAAGAGLDHDVVPAEEIQSALCDFAGLIIEEHVAAVDERVCDGDPKGAGKVWS